MAKKKNPKAELKKVKDGFRRLTPEEKEIWFNSKARIDMRVTGKEKAEIQEAAQYLDMSLTEYLLTLHRLAKEYLK